jgi:hypothetical protein
MARGILDALMANPRGWGMTGAASPEEGVNVPQDPMTPGMAAVNLVRGRAAGEVQSFIDQLPVNAAMMAAGPVVGGIGKVAMAHPGITAALMGGAGLLTTTSDAGPTLTRKQTRQMEMERQRSQLEAEARRQEIEAQAKAAIAQGEAAAKVKADADQKEADLAEYQNQVKRAEMARDFELGRKKRFSETQMGKVYDATGGALPIMAAMGMGAAGRLAHGPGAMGRYVMPAAEGAGAGLATTSIPLLYDYSTDSDNPEKAAYQAYARELPPSHPRKAEFAEYAGNQPDQNPVQKQAQEQFFNPARLGMSAVEGALGGLGGSTLAGVGTRAFNAVRNALMGPKPTAPHWTRQQRINGRFGPMKKR